MHLFRRKGGSPPPWPDPHKSLGVPLPKRGKLFVWHMTGPAKRIFVGRVRPEVNEALQSLGPQDTAFIYKPYMIARDKEGLTASPVVMISGPEEAICKEAMAALRESRCFEKPELVNFRMGYTTVELDSPLNARLRLLASDAVHTKIIIEDDPSMIHVYGHPETQIGRKLRFVNPTDTTLETRQATGGPIICIGDNAYQLTAAHATKSGVTSAQSSRVDLSMDSYWVEGYDSEDDQDEFGDFENALTLASRSSKIDVEGHEDGDSDIQCSPDGSEISITDKIETGLSSLGAICPWTTDQRDTGQNLTMTLYNTIGTNSGDDIREKQRYSESFKTYTGLQGLDPQTCLSGDELVLSAGTQFPSSETTPESVDLDLSSGESVNFKQGITSPESIQNQHMDGPSRFLGAIDNPSTGELALDYALLKLPSHGIRNANKLGIGLPDAPIYIRNVANVDDDLKDDIDVLIVTSHGTIRGKLSCDSTMAKFPGSQEFQRVLTAHLSGEINVGDSGSAVIDAETGDFYGLVVMGTIPGSVVYIVPAVDIFADIRSRLGKIPSLYVTPNSINEPQHELVQGTSCTTVSQMQNGYSWGPDEKVSIRRHIVIPYQDHSGPRPKSPTELNTSQRNTNQELDWVSWKRATHSQPQIPKPIEVAISQLKRAGAKFPKRASRRLIEIRSIRSAVLFDSTHRYPDPVSPWLELAWRVNVSSDFIPIWLSALQRTAICFFATDNAFHAFSLSMPDFSTCSWKIPAVLEDHCFDTQPFLHPGPDKKHLLLEGLMANKKPLIVHEHTLSLLEKRAHLYRRHHTHCPDCGFPWAGQERSLSLCDTGSWNGLPLHETIKSHESRPRRRKASHWFFTQWVSNSAGYSGSSVTNCKVSSKGHEESHRTLGRYVTRALVWISMNRSGCWRPVDADLYDLLLSSSCNTVTKEEGHR